MYVLHFTAVHPIVETFHDRTTQVNLEAQASTHTYMKDKYHTNIYVQ